MATAAVGGIIGALLLITTPAAAFRWIVPWLTLLSTVAFALSGRVRTAEPVMTRKHATLHLPTLLAITTYGGYFNGGLGFLLLAHASWFGQQSMLRAQAQKNLVSALLTAVAVIVYAIGGEVAWLPAAIMTTGAIVGSYLGARLLKRMNPQWLRVMIVLTGLAVTVALFV